MEDRKEQILRAAIRGARLYGLDGLRIQHIGELAKAAPSSIYTYFGGKEELMRACFERVDRQIAAIFDRMKLPPSLIASDPEAAVRHLWIAYFHWLIDHPDETVFYHRYRDSRGFPEYERTRDVSYFASFLRIIRQFEEHYHVFERVHPDLLWLHLLTTTVLYAKYTVEGVLPMGEETEEQIFRLEMTGLHGVLASEGSG